MKRTAEFLTGFFTAKSKAVGREPHRFSVFSFFLIFSFIVTSNSFSFYFLFLYKGVWGKFFFFFVFSFSKNANDTNDANDANGINLTIF